MGFMLASLLRSLLRSCGHALGHLLGPLALADRPLGADGLEVNALDRGRHAADRTLADVSDLLVECDGPFGRLTQVALAARLSETPASWSRPAASPWTPEAAWPA
jgi:hypothetical protein